MQCVYPVKKADGYDPRLKINIARHRNHYKDIHFLFRDEQLKVVKDTYSSYSCVL